MEISALASGSSGNCFYIGNEKTHSGVLIDAGISSKSIIERLRLIGRKPELIKAILITHEHSDHIRGADVFARQFNIPIFATKKTFEDRLICKDSDLINHIKNNEFLKIAGLDIEAFSKPHKAADPVSFSIINHKRVSVITDLGHCSKAVIDCIQESNALFLESNHDVNMLQKGPYPYYLKKWVGGDEGHLSNMQASLGILEHGSRKLSNLILSHLSKTNNTPELALHTINALVKERKDLNPKIIVSNRETPMKLIKI
jgi:phosphoribosyl 1,2-cyclic phosphodiesterase